MRGEERRGKERREGKGKGKGGKRREAKRREEKRREEKSSVERAYLRELMLFEPEGQGKSFFQNTFMQRLLINDGIYVCGDTRKKIEEKPHHL